MLRGCRRRSRRRCQKKLCHRYLVVDCRIKRRRLAALCGGSAGWSLCQGVLQDGRSGSSGSARDRYLVQYLLHDLHPNVVEAVVLNSGQVFQLMVNSDRWIWISILNLVVAESDMGHA